MNLDSNISAMQVISSLHLLVSMITLVRPNLNPGAEALWTELEAAVSALDPDQAGLVDIIPTAGTEILLTEVEGHPGPPIPSCPPLSDLIL